MPYDLWQYVFTAALFLAAGSLQTLAPHQQARQTDAGPVTRALGVAAVLVGVGALLML